MTKKPWRAGKDLSAVVENMEIGTGQRGDGRHAFVTREELVGLKLARRRTSGGAAYALKGSLTPTRITGMRRWVWSSSDSGCRNTTSDGLSITICWRAISL